MGVSCAHLTGPHPLGQGNSTLNLYHSDCMLMSPVVVAGLLMVAVSMLDLNNGMHWGWRAGKEGGIGLVMWFVSLQSF